MEILGLGPFEGLVREFSVETRCFRLLFAQHQMQRREEDDRREETEDCHFRLEERELGEVPVVDCGVDVGNEVIEGHWVVQICCCG